MNVRKTWLAAMAVASVATLALTGCSGGGEPADENALEMWHNSTTGDGKAYWDEVAAAFEAETGVKVTMTSIQNEDMDGKLQTASNSGDMPDIFMARGGGKLADFVDAGVVKDLTDLISDDAHAAYGDAAFSAFTVEGATYGMPVAVLPQGMFYSEDLFADAGITAEPETMDELDDAVAKLKASGVEPIALGAKAAWPAAHWYYGFALRACAEDVLQNISTSATPAGSRPARTSSTSRRPSPSTTASSRPTRRRAPDPRQASSRTTRRAWSSWAAGTRASSDRSPRTVSRSPISAGSRSPRPTGEQAIPPR
jgi:multiple sugar transport system substrate-binding protein/raffinose/stachyose/melibiose transport system substrate-binding protein